MLFADKSMRSLVHLFVQDKGVLVQKTNVANATKHFITLFLFFCKKKKRNQCKSPVLRADVNARIAFHHQDN